MSGGVDRTIAVNVRPPDLQAAHVSVADVVNALNSQNLAAPVGAVLGTLTEQQIRLQGRLETPEDFLQLVVASRGGQLVRLGQVADVKDTSVEARSVALYNGQLGIGMDITKSKGVSTTRVADDIKARIAELQKTLPRGVRLSPDPRCGRARAQLRPQRRRGADRGRAADGARRVPVPQQLALDDHHRSRAAGVDDRRVHRGVGVRVHAQHDVAARTVAGDRHPDRRRDRGPGEHRPAHRDGRRPRRGRRIPAPTRSGWR